MTPATLLRQLHQRDVRLEAAGNTLRVDAPAGVMSPELGEQIRAYKNELMTILTSTPLLAEWLHEIRLMHEGQDPDWTGWSTLCRATWARQMVEIAMESGLEELVPPQLLKWLQDTENLATGSMTTGDPVISGNPSGPVDAQQRRNGDQ